MLQFSVFNYINENNNNNNNNNSNKQTIQSLKPFVFIVAHLYPSLLSALRNGSKADAEAIKAAGSQWLRNVVACGDAGLRGFEKDRITPYGHLIGTHGYEFVKQLGPMGKFSGEKLEALNDSFKMGHLRQTNGRDLHASILVQKRKEIAMRREAERRQKQNAQKVPKLGC